MENILFKERKKSGPLVGNQQSTFCLKCAHSFLRIEICPAVSLSRGSCNESSLIQRPDCCARISWRRNSVWYLSARSSPACPSDVAVGQRLQNACPSALPDFPPRRDRGQTLLRIVSQVGCDEMPNAVRSVTALKGETIFPGGFPEVKPR